MGTNPVTDILMKTDLATHRHTLLRNAVKAEAEVGVMPLQAKD